MTAEKPTPSVLAIYARIVPVLALLLLVWLVGSDQVLRRTVEARSAETAVTWGFRTVRSELSESDEEPLRRTYEQAAERIESYYDGIEDKGAVADLIVKAQRTQDAYLWLHLRGWLSLTILLIGALFLLAAAFLKRLGLVERSGFVLVGCCAGLAGVGWFRWCFGAVSEDIGFADDGRYGFAAPADLTIFVLCAGLAFSVAALLTARRRAASASTSEA